MALVQSLKEFNKLSAIPFGISSNTIEQHSEFAKNHNLSINLLADPDNSVIKTYTGTSKIGTVSSRQSFLIDPQGILRKIYNPVNAFSHAEEVLSDLKTLTEVIDQLGLLKRRQREMQDSINAASRIQNALLPNLKSILPINFGISLFYKPLEKIGGDCFGQSLITIINIGLGFLIAQVMAYLEHSLLWSYYQVFKELKHKIIKLLQ